MNLPVITELQEWRAHLDAARGEGRRVGLVPTMGALHGGHLSLIRRAAADGGMVAVTDYVNPLQFGPSEDLAAYPRRLAADVRLAAEAGADVVFAPAPEQMWPSPPQVSVRVAGLSEILEGAARPTHFDGVATIVAKLLSITGPCTAYFGEKDFQQLALIRRLVEDLSLAAEVVACPTVRDTDGLALSSRNAYLTPAERVVAPQLYWALLAGKRAIEDEGITDPAAVRERMSQALSGPPPNSPPPNGPPPNGP
ncbi:MAG: pantoate--beta-alanine ligase, partial [Actinomycetota bacterium]|nr:pantoate--beta-alanine ligase [Actinomycetota bacterium]